MDYCVSKRKHFIPTGRLRRRKQPWIIAGCDRFTIRLHRKKIDDLCLISLSKLRWVATESLYRYNWSVNRFYLFSISTASINDDHCSFHCYWDVYLYHLLDVQTKTA